MSDTERTPPGGFPFPVSQRHPSDVAREMAAMRRKSPGVCARCGAPFVRLRTARFCSKACASASTQRERTARWLARKAARGGVRGHGD